MKKKLQKDLKFLKYTMIKFFTALFLGFLASIIAGVMTTGNSYHKEDIQEITWLVSTILFFIGIYFFTAWLYGDEDETNITK